MRIALDSTYSLDRDISGVGIYSREIMFGLARSHPEAVFEFRYRPHRFIRSFLDSVPSNCRRRLLTAASTGRCDIFHGLNQRLPRARIRRAVSTFHDLFVMTGDYATPDFRRRFAERARAAAAASDHIITVSAFTASQLHDLLGVERERVTVVHHGVRGGVWAPSRPRRNIILHVGAIQTRKNITRLVEAFERLDPGWKLVLAGSGGYGSAQILERIERSPVRGSIQVLGYVSEERLRQLYGCAGIFAFPSLDEGFGMPVLEAMSSGVPVLTSNRSALPEVAGDAALLVDPENTDAIAGALARMVGNESLRNELAERGFHRARMFTWQAAVEKTWAVYRRLL